jgi:hypothetical protein
MRFLHFFLTNKVDQKIDFPDSESAKTLKKTQKSSTLLINKLPKIL